MSATKTKTRVVQTQTTMYLLPEYRDPVGPNMPPWKNGYYLSEALCQARGLDPYSLLMYQAADFSNVQKFKPGDICIIDTSHRLIQDGMRYLIQHPMGARVRRAFVGHDKSITLCPDVMNPNFRPEVVRPESVHLVHVIGWVALVVCWGD